MNTSSFYAKQRHFLFLVFTIILCICVPKYMANAESGPLDEESIYYQIQDLFGTESDIDDFSYGCKIPTYVYDDDHCLVETDFSLYPIFSFSRLFCFAIVDASGNSTITDGLVGELNAYLDQDIALIYDQCGSWIYTKDENPLLCIKKASVEMPGRGLLNSNAVIEGISTSIFSEELQFSSIPKYSVQYDPNALIATIPVSYISQNPPSNLCWMATATCIGNKLTGSSYTCSQNASWWYNSGNTNVYNQPGSVYEANLVLIYRYNVAFSLSHLCPNAKPTVQCIYNNISAGYPMYGRFWIFNLNGESNTHAVVIRGLNTNTSKIYLMDPEVGFVSGNIVGDGYNYTRIDTGALLCMIGHGSVLD